MPLPLQSSSQLNPYKYVPREWTIPLHNRVERSALLVIHRRAGKTIAAVNDVIIAGLECPLHRPQFAYVAPTYVEAKRIAWEYLKEYTRPLLTRTKSPSPISESELRVDILSASGTPARIFLAGADNPDSLRGIYLDGAVVDESARIPPAVVGQVLRPALSDRGGWLIKMGTPKGKNHFYEDYLAAQADPSMFCLFLPASLSNIIPPEELALLRKEMTPDEYEQEMECSFTAMSKGAILFAYVEQALKDGRISAHPYPTPYEQILRGQPLPVYASFDIGRSDLTGCWFWHMANDGLFDLVWHDQATGWEAQEWCNHLRRVAKDRNYDIRLIHLPHDARNRSFVAKHTALEVFLQSFPGRVRVIPRSTLEDRINAARTVIKHCRFWGPEVCGAGLKALRQWQFRWDDVLNAPSREPLHDEFSHSADAFSYGSQVMSYYVPQEEAPPTDSDGVLSAPLDLASRKQTLSRGVNYAFTLEELHHAR